MMLMQGVKNNVRLHFKFAREPQQRIKNDDDEDVEVFLEDSEGNVPETYDGYDGHRRDGSSDNDVGPERPQAEHTTCKKRKRAVNDSSPSINDKGSTKDVIENNNCDSGVCGAPMDTIRNKPHTPKTIITYTIDYSVDFGRMERLLGVDIHALDEHPSLEEAIPLLSEEEEEQNEEVEDNDSEKGDESVVQRKNNIASRNDAEYEEVDMSDDEDDDSPPIENKNSPSCGGDRFGVYIHPENVVAFLDRTNLNLNDRSVFYFLLTFPFYEHEWDIPGFVCGALFDDDDDDDDDNDEEDIQDQICCLPCN